MTSFRDTATGQHRHRTWLLTGIPRSGSSLACRLAGELPEVVALSEPIPRSEFEGISDTTEACERIARFADRTRRRIATERRAPSVHVGGRLDDDVVARETGDGLRRRQAIQGEIGVNKPLTEGFRLLVKHNALFAALLPEVAATAPCIALVRNPLVVLASWQTVDLPVHRGRIPAGEQFDGDLRRALDATPSSRTRQVIILNWFFAAYADGLPAMRILRYEDLVASGGAVLSSLLGHPGAPRQLLTSRNDHAVYREVDVDELLATLRDTGGAWTRFYSRADCEAAAAAIRRIRTPGTACGQAGDRP